MTFDEYWEERAIMDYLRPLAEHAWDAATAEAWKNPPDGWYRIGEEVEVDYNGCWVFGHVTSEPSRYPEGESVYIPRRTRRKPAWTPKDGEAVLVCGHFGKAYPAVSAGGTLVYVVPFERTNAEVKPFSADNIGKRWDAI